MTENEVVLVKSDDKTLKQWKISWALSVLVMVCASALQHFLYDWTHCPFIGLWSPVGESIAEHDKLMFYPILMWWIIMFFAFRKKKEINATAWFTSAGISATVALSLMTVFYCTFFMGFAWPQKLPLHIMFEILSFIIAQLVGYHLYKNMKPSRLILALSILQAAAVIILMAVLTFYPPNSPAFWIVEY